LAPHADDETIGCGGILALHRKQGDPVQTIIVTDGMMGDPAGYYPEEQYGEIRRGEARKAARALGIADPLFWNYSDGSLLQARNLTERIAGLIQRERPELLYAPALSDTHPDHWALGRACLEAVRQETPTLRLFGYEIWGPLQATHLVNIGRAWRHKTKAIRCYRSQLRYIDYLRIVEGLNAARTLHYPSARYAEALQEIHPT
jgi:LmbE family N-acetylglucosaminyl deacetylase